MRSMPTPIPGARLAALAHALLARLASRPLAAASLSALTLMLAASPLVSQAQSMGGVSALTSYSNLTTLDPYPPEQGWQGLARALDHLRPGFDTRLEPTPSQVTDRIETKINAGDYAGALALITQREAQLKGKPGSDVQLMFQHARALAGQGRTGEAASIYTNMTTRFPELPEPWNNLAALQARQGKLDAARESLSMALKADPDYADAQANLKRLTKEPASK